MSFKDVTIHALRWRNGGHKDGKMAGLIAVEVGDVILHLFTRSSHWIWGRQTEPYDLCLEYFGVGPLFLLVWPGGDDLVASLRRSE